MRAASRCGSVASQAFAKLVAHGLIVERGLAGEEFRGDAHVHRALLVRLFGHRIHTAAGLAELAGDPGEVDQLQDVLIAVRPPHDAFGAENDGAGRFRKDRRRLFELFDRHAGLGRHLSKESRPRRP